MGCSHGPWDGPSEGTRAKRQRRAEADASQLRPDAQKARVKVIATVTPNQGIVGTEITLSGQLALTDKIMFRFANGEELPLLESNTAPIGTSVTVLVTGKVPQGLPAGTVTIIARDEFDAELGTASINFSVLSASAPAPVAARVFPSNGSTVGGETIEVTGSGLQSGATVTIGGKACTTVTVDANGLTLSCVTPANVPGAQDLVVLNPDGQAGNLSNGYTYSGAIQAAPSLTQIAPNVGPTAGGTSVQLTGSGFIAGVTSVTFGGNSATNVMVSSETSLTCTTPSGTAGATTVVVSNSFGSATRSDLFTYQAAAAPDLTLSGSVTTITAGPFAGQKQLSFKFKRETAGASISNLSANPITAQPSGSSVGSFASGFDAAGETTTGVVTLPTGSTSVQITVTGNPGGTTVSFGPVIVSVAADGAFTPIPMQRQ